MPVGEVNWRTGFLPPPKREMTGLLICAVRFSVSPPNDLAVPRPGLEFTDHTA